jgi:diguanylate cyclase (GGDEF)-like protein/PAS domain S-box-containing protein
VESKPEMSANATAARSPELTTFCQVFDLLHDAVIIADASGHIRYGNVAAGRLFGYQPEELLHSELHDLIPARFRARHEHAFREYMLSGEPRPMSERPMLHGLARSGKEIPVSVSLCTVEAGKERFAIAIVRSLATLASQINEARALAETDSLTGLGNRMHLSAQLGRLVGTAGSRFALLYLDLDAFKAINDRHGHECGDRVLKIVASRLKASVRDWDLVARVGGDEFVVVLTGVSDDPAVEQIAAKLALVVSQRFNAKGIRGTVGASVGWAIFPRDGHTEAELVRIADERMYQQKTVHREHPSAR